MIPLNGVAQAAWGWGGSDSGFGERKSCRGGDNNSKLRENVMPWGN